MSFDYSKLRRKIREKCGTVDTFAKKINLGRVSMSMRLNNKLDFHAQEIKKACEILEIPLEEIPEYFFCTISSETRTDKSL